MPEDLDQAGTGRYRVLMLRAPGAQSDVLGYASEELVTELKLVCSEVTTVVSAVGTPSDHLPYEYDVLAWIEPADDEVQVTIRASQDGEPMPTAVWVLPMSTARERRQIACQIGRYLAEQARRVSH